mmetsp:Transcript_39764/g.87296  ORF Transcript_39764/g.87296 Transcript_39764/m.87296 type:complete len:236 (-) Transcript_39764:576-1283(-)
MPCRAFGRRDLHLVRMVAEDALVGHRLELVVEGRRGAVRVDVLHLLRRDAGRVHGEVEALGHALALGVGCGDVVRVAGGGVAGELAVDVRAARERVLLRLEEQHARALAHDEARAVGVERSAGCLRRVVARRAHGAHRVEAGEAERRHRRLAPAREHHVGLAVLDVLERLADGVCPRRARAHNAVIGSLCVDVDGNHRARSVPNDRGQQKGSNALRPLGHQDLTAGLNGLQATDA